VAFLVIKMTILSDILQSDLSDLQIIFFEKSKALYLEIIVSV